MKLPFAVHLGVPVSKTESLKTFRWVLYLRGSYNRENIVKTIKMGSVLERKAYYKNAANLKSCIFSEV